MPESQSAAEIETPKRGWLAGAIPLLVFVAIAVFLAIGLTRNPREVPSPLIGRAVPKFSLPPVLGRILGLSDRDLKGEVSVVNVFASWCVPCRQEHPLIQRLAREVPVHGLNHKDQPEDAARWLDELGDPYTRTGADRDGRIVYKQIGPIPPRVLEDKLLPLIRKLQKQKDADR